MATTLNRITIIGRLGKDPEIRELQQGGMVCRLSIATDDSFINKMGAKVEQTTWHRVNVFGKAAEACERYLKKGRIVYVEGKLLNNKFVDKNGLERTTIEIKCQNIIFLSQSSQQTNDDNIGNRQPSGFDDSDMPF